MAHVGDRVLTADQLASWMVLGQPLPLDSATARGLARHWVEVTAVVQALARGDSLTSPNLIENVAWPETRRLLANRYLTARTDIPEPTPAEVTEAYEAGELRLVAQVLRAVSPRAHPEERQRQRETAERIRDSLTAGGNWPEAVTQSEDPETRERNGLIGLVGRGELDPSLEATVFNLRPGEVSKVVEGRQGFHILYRPRLEDVRPLFAARLAERREAAARADSIRALVDRRELTLADTWDSEARKVAADPWTALSDGAVVARFRDGSVEDSVLARYLVVLPPQSLARLESAQPAEVRSVVHDVAGQEILWRRVQEEGLELTDDERDQVRSDYVGALDRLWSALGVEAGDAQPALPIGADPARMVKDYMEAVMARRVDLAPVPPYLVVELLRDTDWEVNEPGSGAAVDAASRMLAEAEGS